jgi:hypothetical protein
MSVIGNNPLLKGVSGMLANLIVFREVRGKTIIANRPKKTGILTPHQQKMKSRFINATQYAKKQMLNEQIKAEYAKGINDRKHSAYAVALTDYMTTPKVNDIGLSKYKGTIGDTITINATDDFKVTGVHVVILNSTGEVIEQGEAFRSHDETDEWRYVITTTNTTLSGTKITARATDRPGNIGSMEVVIS